MGPSTRTRRQRSKPQASVETLADNAPLLSDGKIPSNDRESSNTGHEAGMTISLVAGVWTPVPRTYNPETYDPEGQVQRTPEPYDPDTYAAWGRRHFGDEWYKQRKTMLQERNIYAPDAAYGRRQRDLRVVEHKIDGRPFKPRDGVLDKGWQRLWARLSKDLPSVETPGTPASFQLNDSNSNSNVSGYSTYPPTPEPRVLTPEPDDPWEKLELNRRRLHWDEERYRFERVFLKEGLIDKARNEREDEEGDRRAREEWKAISDLKLRDLDKYSVEKAKYERRMRDLDLRGKGWTQEQIEAADGADAAFWEWRQKNTPPRGPSLSGPSITQDERDAHDNWLQKERAARLRIYGELPPSGFGSLGQDITQKEKEAYDTWRQNIHARISSQHKQEPREDATADASRAKKKPPHEARGGRITKNTAKSQGIADQDTRSQPTAPTLSQVSIADRRSKRVRAFDVVDKPNESTRQDPWKIRKRQPKVHKNRASDAARYRGDQVLQSKPHNTRQRKVYKQERGSRRLAGHLPEYGMLPKRGEPAPPYEPPSNTLEPPSNTRQPNPSGPRSRPSSKTSVAVKGAKPRGISKPGREEANRPKRSKKQSEG